MGLCFCFNLQFFGWQTICRLVVREKSLRCVVTLKAGKNYESKPPKRKHFS